MRKQDRQQRERKGQTRNQPGRMQAGFPKDSEIPAEIEERQVVIEVVLHARADRRGGKQGQKQQQEMNPEPLTPPNPDRLEGEFKPLRKSGRERRRRDLLGHELLKRLQLFARFEADGFAGRNGYFGAGAGVTPNTSLTRLYVENAETTQFDAITHFQGLLHFAENGFDSHLGFRLRNAGLVHHFIDDVEFDQRASAAFKLMINLSLRHVKQRGRSRFPPRVRKVRNGCGGDYRARSRGNAARDDSEFVYFVSLDPPIVLVCIDNRAAILDHLLAARSIGINVLTESQAALSVRFARPGEDRFGSVEWYPGTLGVPLIPEVLAVLECEVKQVVPAGDHQVFLAEARSVAWREERPLVYFSSGYRELSA